MSWERAISIPTRRYRELSKGSYTWENGSKGTEYVMDNKPDLIYRDGRKVWSVDNNFGFIREMLPL